MNSDEIEGTVVDHFRGTWMWKKVVAGDILFSFGRKKRREGNSGWSLKIETVINKVSSTRPH